MRDPRALPRADELRVCPEPEPSRAEDLVSDRELFDRRADRFDVTRELCSEDSLLRSANARDEAADERNRNAATSVGFTSRTVRPGDRHGADLDEDLVLLGGWPLDLLESQNVGRPVPVVHNCPHESAYQYRKSRPGQCRTL